VTSQAQVSLRDLESNAQTYRALYDNFLQRYMESVQQQSFPVTEARVITAATRPLSKSSPKALLVLGIATVLGSAIGFLAAAWREFTDQVFRTADQVESVLQADCIALIPLVTTAGAKDEINRRARLSEPKGFGGFISHAFKLAQERNLEFPRMRRELKTVADGGSSAMGINKHLQGKNEVQTGKNVKLPYQGSQTIAVQDGIFSEIIDAPFAPFAEAIRSVKVAIDQSPTAAGGRIIGFTSSVPNEGKSSIAAAVARWMAKTGARTLLVDCDVRNPTLSRSLSPGVMVGLLEVVKAQAPLEKAIWSDAATGMKFLPVAMKGRLAHSSEILASVQMRKVLDALRGSFDYIIVDFSPLMPIVDVRVSTNLVDSYVYVVGWGETRIEFVKRALRSGRGVYDRLLGVVLNKVNLTAIDRYEAGSGYYTHRHYARYGYTE
jgi:succinoglycan biosynthesis transport protein ExoP